MNDVKVTIDKEVTESEFSRFIDSMGILIPENMKGEDLQSFEDAKSRIIDALKTGALIVNDEGEMVFTPRRSEDKTPIHFKEPEGAALKSMDRAKRNEDVSKSFIALGEMTGNNTLRFSKMKLADLKVCLAILSLFFG